MFDLSPFLHV